MWCRRILRSVAVLGAASATVLSCSSSSSIDMYFGTDAGKGFDAPPRETFPGTGGAGGTAGAAGTGAGGDSGAGGTTGDGVDAGDAGGTTYLIRVDGVRLHRISSLIGQHQHPNRPPYVGAA
jgi:hypothetical protein